MESKDQDTKASGESQPGQGGGFNPMGMMKKMMEKMMSGMMTPEDMPRMMYLAGIKDVFTCEIVGHAMGERMTQELVSRALWKAMQWKRPAAGLIHHSDRGSQYCAHGYRKLLDQFGLSASMSRRGNCYDNAPMESFWGSLKNELVHHQRYATRSEAKASIREYIEIFYNRQRRHSRLGYLAPAVFAQKFSSQQAAA